MFHSIYTNNKTIYEHEKTFWEKKIEDIYELYEADIDTTFCLVNKKGEYNKKIRIAGNFTAKHLPWYKHNSVYNIYENYKLCNKTTNISTTSSKIIGYIDENYIKIHKNGVMFHIQKGDPNFNFWENIYSTWEQDTFQIFDRFLDVNKVFIDIGAWIGTTCIYAARKSKHIYAIDADIESYTFLETNCKNNCNNYTTVNKAIYAVDDRDIVFGKNLYIENSKLNDSTSHIYINKTSDKCYYIRSIRLQTLIETYHISYNEISLIKVDIEGGEEFILNDLHDIYSRYNIPMYISFHYSWWKDANLDRFSFLTEGQKNTIIRYPFISLLFS